jgi:hypothetical protein
MLIFCPLPQGGGLFFKSLSSAPAPVNRDLVMGARFFYGGSGVCCLPFSSF